MQNVVLLRQEYSELCSFFAKIGNLFDCVFLWALRFAISLIFLFLSVCIHEFTTNFCRSDIGSIDNSYIFWYNYYQNNPVQAARNRRFARYKKEVLSAECMIILSSARDYSGQSAQEN